MTSPEQQSLGIQSSTEPLLAVLCKGVIEAAYDHSEVGVPESSLFEMFSRVGISRLQFDLFLQSMVRARLVVPSGSGTLRPTTRGLAYAGIDVGSQRGLFGG